MSITTETNEVQLLTTISFNTFGESGFVKVNLDNTFYACFHTYPNRDGSIRITSPYSKTDLAQYTVPASKMLTLLAFAIQHPSGFRDACRAFLSHS